jgi:hypothetical protein
VLQALVDNCTAERNETEQLIAGAGLTFKCLKKNKKRTHLELKPANVSVSLQLSVTDLMAGLLTDSPSWYNIGSGVTHSSYWGLRDISKSRPDGPMELIPQVLEAGAAAESAISVSRLIIDRFGRCFGHDPSRHTQQSTQRREAIDALMVRAARNAWVNIPTE